MYVLPMSAADALFLHFQSGTESSVLLSDIQRITFVDDNLQIKTTENVETIAFSDIAKITFGEMIVTAAPVVETLRATSLPEIIGYYNIMGQKLSKEPQSGLYIVLYDNGKVVKVVK